jgi:hypothetical protein
MLMLRALLVRRNVSWYFFGEGKPPVPQDASSSRVSLPDLVLGVSALAALVWWTSKRAWPILTAASPAVPEVETVEDHVAKATARALDAAQSKITFGKAVQNMAPLAGAEIPVSLRAEPLETLLSLTTAVVAALNDNALPSEDLVAKLRNVENFYFYCKNHVNS